MALTFIFLTHGEFDDHIPLSHILQVVDIVEEGDTGVTEVDTEEVVDIGAVVVADTGEGVDLEEGSVVDRDISLTQDKP